MEILELIPTKVNAETLPDLRISDCEFTPGYLKIFLTDRRIVSLPEDWLPFPSNLADDQLLEVSISQDGYGLYWPKIPAFLSLRDILAGSESCENCWFRVSFYQ